MAKDTPKDLKTTLAGIVIGLGILFTQLGHVLDTDPATVLSVPVVLTGLGALGLGWWAKDK